MIATLRFKSTPDNWIKEFEGRKPWTMRKKDLSDERHLALGAMMATNDYGYIEIQNTLPPYNVFKRKIIDVTEWEGWIGVSWKHKKDKLDCIGGCKCSPEGDKSQKWDKQKNMERD